MESFWKQHLREINDANSVTIRVQGNTFAVEVDGTRILFIKDVKELKQFIEVSL